MCAMVSDDGSEATAFDGYVEALIDVIGHAERAEPLWDYCTGLMMPVARKSVEPLAAVTAPSRVSAKHQLLLHFVGQAPWSDKALMARVREWALPRMIERGGAISAWIIDDTGFPNVWPALSASRANIAVSSASKIIARLPSVFRLRTRPPVYR
jgi:SRSO17 transposase